MTFYLLAFVVALTTIFGLAHSQTAREKLHLQNLYNRSLAAIQQHLQNYDSIGIHLRNYVDNEIVEVLEIDVDQDEVPLLEEVETSGSLEEIEGIRLGSDDSDNAQRTPDSSTSQEPTATSTPTDPPHKPTITNKRTESDARDTVLAAINASLQKLSTAANSGRINGAQLYDILVQETMMHDKAMNAEGGQAAAAASAGGNNNDDNGHSGTEIIREVRDDEEEDKPKMYFGEKPLEYVAHRAQRD